ncbi:hypothetical protein HG531_008075 [Fusarium graminearum]|nr:hypothetical protein HG531_008075 [Fusarium graminearum]
MGLISWNLRGRLSIQPYSDRLERVSVGEVLDLDVPARGLEVTVAPGVIVESKEVGSDLFRTAVHVVSSLHAVGGNIGSGVTDGNLAKLASLDVVSHVTGDGLDVRSRLVGVLLVVHDLVTGEESEGVLVLGEHLDSSKNTLDVGGIVRRAGGGTVDGVLGVVDIKDKIDASVVERLHALIVIGLVVDGVNANNVDAEFLEVLDITLADLGVGQRILVSGGTTGLVVNTSEVETLVTGPES